MCLNFLQPKCLAARHMCQFANILTTPNLAHFTQWHFLPGPSPWPYCLWNQCTQTCIGASPNFSFNSLFVCTKG